DHCTATRHSRTDPDRNCRADFVGPQDLPKLMRSAGQFVAKARKLAGEFTAAFDQMARETEMQELREEIETLKKENVFAQTKRDLDENLKPVNEALNKESGELKTAQKDAPKKPDASADDAQDEAPADTAKTTAT
ncbi:MAG: hypothetical protein KJN99_08205, partial [Marinicaulis sp.]|nr:hypothetical protein [Marinicaulis sp.]